MRSKIRRLRARERKFLRLYSAWQETHRIELVESWNKLLAEILYLNPAYSFRHAFEQAF